ncbi:complex I subunit 5 family protein [Acuticoccus kandeliae]|uniref:complex I subunit 5 family protein n=1 Tax=Acuticoccus kandeliae TaxID=2073160 RepID=UPI000D3E0DC5|nr:proton-conducting transporter membrane subunit [Acuticoccus kandeliae]
MVSALAQPLAIFLFGLGGGFAIPLFYRLGKGWLHAAFAVALGGILAVSVISLAALWWGADTIEVLTAGATPPLAISLRFGLAEGAFSVSVNLFAVFCAMHLWERLRGNYVALLLFLILVMGINGMIMTRDLFNLFVFLEIVSIGTYGLFGLDRRAEAVAAAFKYIMATVLASAFFLLGATLVYNATGTLSIDALIDMRGEIGGPVATAGLLFILACLLVELKPFPANGWGLDVYETAPTGVASMVSVGVSTGVFFALLKLLPLFAGELGLIAILAAITFLAANLMGLAQTKVRRLLGYSSIGQMALLTMALALLTDIGAYDALPLVLGGLFVNHLLAKAGLFWLTGLLKAREVSTPLKLARKPFILILLGVLVVAITGMPPFPGFFGKWALIMELAAADRFLWIALILVGSLLEAVYIYRWFFNALASADARPEAPLPIGRLVPVIAMAVLLILTGLGAANASGVGHAWLFAPLIAGFAFTLLDGLPGPLKTILLLASVVAVGTSLAFDTHGIAGLFSTLLLAGSIVIGIAGLAVTGKRTGHAPLAVVLLLSIPALLRAETSLEFFFAWELITLASTFLIARGAHARPHVLPYLLFSIAAAFLLVAGFAGLSAVAGTDALSALFTVGPAANLPFALLAAGCLVKAGAIGVHVWLPGAYAEADDDVTALLSAVISKVAIFGLLMASYLAIRSDASLDLSEIIAWIGVFTTVGGAILALREDDVKRLLAYSSMSQLGYIITAIALMSHLGWVTAVYLVANHMLVKGILFLALAGILIRTGTRRLSESGGLLGAMPFTFATVAVALLAMSGLPPLMGFGGKWLLLSAMTDKGWYVLAVATLLATFLGLVYMTRILVGLFLGPRRREASEAPVELVLPQILLAGGILVLSFAPKLLMDPVSKVIDPTFASTLVWEGASLETIYGTWDPTGAMLIALGVSLVLFGLWWTLLRRHDRPSLRAFVLADPLIPVRLLPPVATFAWARVGEAATRTADSARRIYSGDGQTYALYVLVYVLAVYLARTGLDGLIAWS